MQIEYPRQSASQTIDQLLAIGVLTDRHIVDGGVRISFRESRNAVSIVEISDTYGFVCKIGTRQWWETESKIVAEARFYRYVWHDPSFVQLQAFVPRLVDYDPASSRLIVTACLPEMSLHDLWFRPKGKEPSRFAALGRALKRVRSVGKAVVQGRHPFGRIGSTQPWIINLATGRFFPVPASNAAATGPGPPS